jgi:hypothetical protein
MWLKKYLLKFCTIIIMIKIIYTTIFFTFSCFAEESIGSLLFNGNCATCHHINTPSSAPTITEVRNRYISAFPQKELFIKQLATWVHHPNKEGSIMHDAIDKYGLMPELAFDKESLEIIANYLYEGKIEATTR